VKLDEQRLIDQVLASEEPCLGAIFCSYTFDPAYFEEQVLRAALRLRGDPDEDSARYYEEAREKLREIPVACFVDAGARRPGRRLPYDLYLVRRRTFHPKVYILLYEKEARVAVGSGNLTKSGIEQNTELFFTRRLEYAVPTDAAILRDLDAFFADCAPLADVPTTQLDVVRDTLARRLHSTPAPGPKERPDIRFVSSFDGKLVDRLGEALPAQAKIRRVAVLAPFFEQDGPPSGDDGLETVLGQLLELRPSNGAIFDIALPWDGAPIAATQLAESPRLDAKLSQLWAWRRKRQVDGESVESVEYLTLHSVAAKRVEATAGNGESARLDRAELETAIEASRFWPVARPLVYAPAAVLAKLAARGPLDLWLHPGTELGPGARPRRRPLHAKVILITIEERGRLTTFALTGSANASQMALARSVANGGNVEAGIICCFDGEVTLRELLPTLVHQRLDEVDIVEREIPTHAIDMSAWIKDVEHDAAAKTLIVDWNSTGPQPLHGWRLLYGSRELAAGDGAPADPTRITDFELSATTAEVTLRTGGGEWFIPIRIADIAALPTMPGGSALGLRELLALLGRRIGAERMTAVGMERGSDAVASMLEAVFGEGFGPTDVFKAWWGVVDDLETARTIAAFRHRLVGSTGVRNAWQQLRDVPSDELSRDEVWVYGCELLRELSGVKLGDNPDASAKRQLLDELLARLRSDLSTITPSADATRWLSDVSRFYGVEAPHVDA
jgi:hypothetical protein